MFKGDHLELRRVLGRAAAAARALGHPRVGSEHLLLALTTGDDAVAAVAAGHGANPGAVEAAVRRAAPAGAGAARDQESVAALGIDLRRLFETAGPALLDGPPGREPVFPLGAAASRRRCGRMDPPLGLDAQAAYAASLRLALARREPQHRPEHLALTLIALDPGIDWILTTTGVDRHHLLTDLAAAFPPPHRNPLLRAERRLGSRLRHRDIVRRYQHTTGRTTTGPALTPLITNHPLPRQTPPHR